MQVSKKSKGITKQKIGHIGEIVLISMLAVGAISTLMLFPMLGVVVKPFIKKKKYSPKQIIQRNIASLVRSGLIEEVVMKDGSVKLQLTRRGRWEAFLRSKSKDTLKRKWDKTWRIVIFDVPVSKNKIREELRRAMRLYGFRMIQQSVWVYPHACDDFVELLKSHLGVSNDVLYMKVSYIENDTHLRKEFKI